MTTTHGLVYVDAVRHVGDQEAPLTVGVRYSRLAAAGQQRLADRGMSLHLWSVGDSVTPVWDMELRATDGTILRAAHAVPGTPAEDPGYADVVWGWLIDQITFTAARLPSRFGFWGVQAAETGGWVVCRNGAPQRWTTRAEAEADADLIANHLRPRRSLDAPVDNNWWR